MKITLKEKLMLIKAGYSAKEIRTMETEPEEPEVNNEPETGKPEAKEPEVNNNEPETEKPEPEEPEIDYKAEFEKISAQLKELQQANINKDISGAQPADPDISDIIKDFL